MTSQAKSEVYAMRDYLKSLNVAVDKIEQGSTAEAGYMAEKLKGLCLSYVRAFGFTPFINGVMY